MRHFKHRHGGTSRDRSSPFSFLSESSSSPPARSGGGRRGGRGGGRTEHKTQQLCRQAYRALVTALAGEVRDPLLQGLMVVAVTPAPDARRLLVDLSPGAAAAADLENEPLPLHEVLHRLEDVRGLLRHAVAEAIVRKRAPELMFRLLPIAVEGGDARE